MADAEPATPLRERPVAEIAPSAAGGVHRGNATTDGELTPFGLARFELGMRVSTVGIHAEASRRYPATSSCGPTSGDFCFFVLGDVGAGIDVRLGGWQFGPTFRLLSIGAAGLRAVGPLVRGPCGGWEIGAEARVQADFAMEAGVVEGLLGLRLAVVTLGAAGRPE